MLIQLIYWKSVCSSSIRGKSTERRGEHSSQEQQAFKRSLLKHCKQKFIRYV